MGLSLRETSVAVGAVVLVLIVFGLLARDLWTYLFTAAMAWVISDAVINIIVKGGGRIVQIPILGTRTRFKGHGYLAFFFGITVGTWSSSMFAEILLGLVGVAVTSAESGRLILSGAGNWTSTVLLASLVVGLLIYGDFNVRFYVRD